MLSNFYLFIRLVAKNLALNGAAKLVEKDISASLDFSFIPSLFWL
jgi:hypothetical protein